MLQRNTLAPVAIVTSAPAPFQPPRFFVSPTCNLRAIAISVTSVFVPAVEDSKRRVTGYLDDPDGWVKAISLVNPLENNDPFTT